MTAQLVVIFVMIKPMPYSYLIWLFVFVVIPTVVLVALYWRVLKQHWNVVLLAQVGAMIFSFPWDYISIKEQIWYYETPYIVGKWIWGLPIEEYLFIVLVTLLFSCISLVVWDRIGVSE